MKRRTILTGFGAAGLASALPWRGSASPDVATLVFRGGRIYTARADGAVAEAIAISGDRIVAIGSRATIDGYIGARTRVVDLRGGMLLPGIIDTHTHFVAGSLAMKRLDLSDATDSADISKRVAAWAHAHPHESWILGGNWMYDAFAPSGLPTKALLDRIVPNRPVALDSFDGHSMWLNSKALELAAITRETPDPKEHGVVIGTIVRDPRTGEPTGVLKEAAQQLAMRAIPKPTKAALTAAVNDGIRFANSRGVTSVLNASGDLGEMEFYQMLHARGLLTLRTTTAFSAGSGTRHTLSPEELETFESGRARFSGDWVRSGVIKFFMDGVVETHTAELLTPYADQSTNRGHVYYPPNTFAKMLVELDRRGFNVMTHAIGDGAVRATLDGYEAAIHANGSRDRRWRIEHIEVCHPADVGRFAKLNVIASMQPYHFCCPTPDLSDAWSRNLGRARLREGFVWHDIAATGAVMVHGSDWPVVTIDPLIGIYSGVTREDPHGQPAGGWFPNQRLRMDQVIAGYTRNASYAAFMDDRIGTLEVGKKADLVALSHDLTSIPSSEILNTQIAMTIVDGRVVHEGSATVNRTAELPTRPGDQCACHRLARSVFA